MASFKLIIKVLLNVVALALLVPFAFTTYLFFFVGDDEEQISKSCIKEIELGGYSQFSDPMQRCLEDTTKAVGGVDVIWIFSLILPMLALLLHFASRKLKP